MSDNPDQTPRPRPASEPNHRIASSYDLPCVIYQLLIVHHLWNRKPLAETRLRWTLLPRKNDLPTFLPTNKTQCSSWDLLGAGDIAFQWRASSENELTIVSPASEEGSKCRGYHHQPATTRGQASFAHKAKTQKTINITRGSASG